MHCLWPPPCSSHYFAASCFGSCVSCISLELLRWREAEAKVTARQRGAKSRSRHDFGRVEVRRIY